MSLDAILSGSACLCLLVYRLHDVPALWAALMDFEMGRGATFEQARQRNGWWRLAALLLALINSTVAAVPA